MANAIITYIDNEMAGNLENDFLETLRKDAKFKGEVYVIYYGKNKKFAQRIQKRHKARIIWAKNHFRISNQRNIDLSQLLKKLPANISSVMCVDGGDVWFQAPIDSLFKLLKDNYGFVEENSLAGQDFNLDCINQLKNEKIKNIFLEKTAGYNLVNSGMIAGSKEKVYLILKKTAELTERIGQDFFALDQAIFNYVVRSDGKGISLPKKYNYTLRSNINGFEVKNNLLYDAETKELFNVVHNIGGRKWSFRMFEKGRKNIGFVPPQIPKKLPGTFWGVTVFFNPADYKNKIKNYRIFRESSRKQGLNLLAVELVFGKAPFELKKGDAEILIQLRTDKVLWQKERLINLGIKNLPFDCDKFAWIDADIIFLNDKWIEQTCNLLERYVIVQPFSISIRLPKGVFNANPNEIPFGKEVNLENHKSFGGAYRICQIGREILKRNIASYSQIGFVWAARRQVFEKEGLFDKSVFPSLDIWMTQVFYNIPINQEHHSWFSWLSKSMNEYYKNWSKKIYKQVKGSVYYCKGTVLHLWHGSLQDRGYFFSENILIKKYRFDPEKDIKLTPDGIWTWASNKPELHKAMEKFFLMRKEDGWSFNNDLSLFFYNFPNIFFGNESFFIKKVDRYIGLFGIFLKKYFFQLYVFLKKTQIFLRDVAYYLRFSNKRGIKKLLKIHWRDYEVDIHPENRRMRILSENQIEGMSTENIRFLINEIVRIFARQGVFLEVGTWRGCSLLSAALFNHSTRCIGIDNFSMRKFPQFRNYKTNEKILEDNLKKLGNPKNIEFYKGDYKKVIKDIFSKERFLKVDVYFYDGNHSYENQLEGLKAIKPHLSKKCIIIVDDLNWNQVEKANKDFIKENPGFKSLFKIKTSHNSSVDWWNGIEIIGRLN